MINLKKLGVLQEIIKLEDAVLQYENDSDTECESIEYGDYYEIPEDSDTGEAIGFKIYMINGEIYFQTSQVIIFFHWKRIFCFNKSLFNK